MDFQLIFIGLSTFVIHLIGTLAYAVRIAGVRTRRIAVSLALFNVLVLVSRLSNTFQAPFLAKRMEGNLETNAHLISDFRVILWSATAATALGIFLIPTFQRLFSRAVIALQRHRSVPRLFFRGLSKRGLHHMKHSVVWPATENLTNWSITFDSYKMGILNCLAVALWTGAVFASLYAGCLDPALRVAANSLSSIVNGMATILMFVFIDPALSVLTDDVIDGKVNEAAFRKTIISLAGSRLAGTALAQLILVPAAWLIVGVAKLL